jgi:hypothetical protein
MPHENRPSQPIPSPPPARRSDAGRIRLTQRDITGLEMVAQMYAAPYDLLALKLGVTETRTRGILVRWRRAGLVESGTLCAGPAWCWPTQRGLLHLGYPWTAEPPALSRLAHTRAVLACRLWMESRRPWQKWLAPWRCERQMQAEAPSAGGCMADAEVIWPTVEVVPGQASRGQSRSTSHLDHSLGRRRSWPRSSPSSTAASSTSAHQ